MPKGTVRTLVLTVLALLLALLPAVGALAQSTIVLVNPPSQSVNVNQNVTVEIKVDGVTNLYGVDLRVTFDKAKLEVQDSDAALSGLQIGAGDFLPVAQGFVAQNTADNATGQAQFVFALMAPATPKTGTGVLARITFKAKASGNAVVTLSTMTLSNEQAQPIATTLMNGSITVLPTGGVTPAPTVTPAPGVTVTPIPGGLVYYTVQWGDTLSSIALRYRVTIDAIMRANNLTNANYIRIGQVLLIPGTTPPPPPPPPPGGQTTHVVQPGDNLYRISLRYGVSIDAIVAANRILNPWYIFVGQILVIPGGGQPQPGNTYVVQPGDTIYGIAARNGVTPWSIIALNNLVNPNLIFVGQVLRIR